MNNISIKFLKFARRFSNKSQSLFLPGNDADLPLDFTGQAASDEIKKKIMDDHPCMICRFGGVELDATIRYLNSNQISHRNSLPIKKTLNYVLGIGGPFWWDETIKFEMRNNAGFFPVTEQSLEAFGARMIKDISNIDILGSWMKADLEKEILNLLIGVAKVRLKDLEPYYHAQPWSEALAGKTVLVIHPFAQSIQNQYMKRHLLFEDQRILPKFELLTLKTVQSIGGNDTGFATWFDALESMCEKISMINFDVAIIGAGAYGLPLASFVKSIGKKSIHLGGATQILFGIKGKRWDERPFFQGLYNEHWVRPLPAEVPNNHTSIETGCYW